MNTQDYKKMQQLESELHQIENDMRYAYKHNENLTIYEQKRHKILSKLLTISEKQI